MKKMLAITGPFVPHNETITLLSYKQLRELDVTIDVIALKASEDDTIKKELEKDEKFKKFSIKYLDYDWHDFSIRKDNLNILKILYHLYKYYKLSLKQSKSEKYGYLYSSSVPNYTHSIANIIKKKNKDIVWIASFSDPIKDNLYAELDFSKAKTVKGKMVNYIQRKIHYNPNYQDKTLENADYLIFLSEEQRDYMIKGNSKYLQKSIIIPLTYIKQWSLYEGLLKPCENIKKDKKVFAHFGNIYGFRKIEKFLMALKEIKEEEPDLYNQIVIRQYGYIEMIEKLGLSKTFEICEKIPYEACIHRMKQEADCLMIFDTILEEDNIQPWLPSKIMEYLISKKPIFAIANQKSPTYRMLETNHICASYDVKDIKTKIIKQFHMMELKEFDETQYENKEVIKNTLGKIVKGEE